MVRKSYAEPGVDDFELFPERDENVKTCCLGFSVLDACRTVMY